MSDDSRWQRVPLDQLVDHIESHHHGYLHREVPLAGAMLDAHMRKYWKQHPELMRAHALYSEARSLLEQHLMQEETAGFPLLRRHAADPAQSAAPFVNTIDQHIAQHAKIMDLFRQVKTALWSYAVPADLGPEVAFTCATLAAIEADLAEHVHLENDILFPRARAA